MEEKESLMVMNEKKVDEVKMLSEINEPLLDIDKCSLHELREPFWCPGGTCTRGGCSTRAVLVKSTLVTNLPPHARCEGQSEQLETYQHMTSKKNHSRQ